MRTRNTRLTGMIVGTLLAAGCGTEFPGGLDVPIASPDVNVEVNVEGPEIDVIQETIVEQQVDQETNVDQNADQTQETDVEQVVNDDRIVICHFPPGNPNNARTITVSESALLAHLRHGDTLGPCPDCDQDERCQDDVFCNGDEFCDGGRCVPGADPCALDEICDEDNDRCVECLDDEDCDNQPVCDSSTGSCVQCLDDSDCDDGLICDLETGNCVAEQEEMVTLFSGTLNGESLSTSAPSITVHTGEEITGTLDWLVYNERFPNAVFPVVRTHTWSTDHANDYIVLDTWVTNEESPKVIADSIALTAPSTPGTYYIVAGAWYVISPANIAANDYPAAIFDDGDDLADQPGGTLESSWGVGRFLPVGGSLSDGVEQMPGYAVRVIVESVPECEHGGWVTEAPLNTPRSLLRGAGVDSAGNIYVAGGRFSWFIPPHETNTVERYDGTSWTFVSPMANTRHAHAVASTGGFIYVIGGTDGFQIWDSVERYDPLNDVWSGTAVPPLHTARRDASATVDALGRVWVIGGDNVVAALDSVEVFDPSNPGLRWVERAEHLKQARSAHGTATDAQGRIYAIGGYEVASSRHLSSVERFDPSNPGAGWTFVADIPGPVSQTDAAVTGADGKIYVVAGWLPGYTDRVVRYDPDTDTWEPWTPLPTARNNVGLVLRNDGRIFAIGGDACCGPATLTIVESLCTSPLD